VRPTAAPVTLSRDEANALFARALEWPVEPPTPPACWYSASDLRAAAAEAGISPCAFDQALRDVLSRRTRVGRLEWWLRTECRALPARALRAVASAFADWLFWLLLPWLLAGLAAAVSGLASLASAGRPSAPLSPPPAEAADLVARIERLESEVLREGCAERWVSGERCYVSHRLLGRAEVEAELDWMRERAARLTSSRSARSP
jgi:hypothetical protein